MEEYKTDFLGFAIESGALKFGEFTLKSGRVSPYFFNTGAFSSGAALAKLARAYSMCINERGLEFEMLFGPAYKGIPLVSAISVCYSGLYNRDIGFCFNRKEEKKLLLYNDCFSHKIICKKILKVYRRFKCKKVASIK